MSGHLRVAASHTGSDHVKRFKGDISDLIASILKSPSDLSSEKATQENVISNNPFLPSQDGTCFINSLPVELLAHIFRVGVEMQRKDDDDELGEVKDKEEKKGLENGLRRFREEEEDSGSGSEQLQTLEFVEFDPNDPEWEDDGSEENDEEEDEEGEEEDEEMDEEIPFELLVSHVCRQWRETAVSTPDLWTHIDMDEPHQWDRYEAYVERAKAQAIDLDVVIERDFDEDMFALMSQDDCRQKAQRLMDIIVPKASQWRNFTFTTDMWLYSRVVLENLATIPAAPLLKVFHFHSEYEEQRGEYEPAYVTEPFHLPFHGNAPNLQSVVLSSVHIDWDGATSMFQGLHDLELGYHCRSVLPSWRAFSSYLKNSPQIMRLELKSSGPSLEPHSLPPASATPASGPYDTASTAGDSEGGDPYEWPRYPFEVPSLRELVLSAHEPAYALTLATKLYFPNLRFLSLDYETEDFTEVVEAYSHPLRGVDSRRSLFQTLEALEIRGLGTVRSGTFNTMVEALSGLKHLTLDCRNEEEDVGPNHNAPGKLWLLLYDNAYNMRKFKKAEARQAAAAAKLKALDAPAAPSDQHQQQPPAAPAGSSSISTTAAASPSQSPSSSSLFSDLSFVPLASSSTAPAPPPIGIDILLPNLEGIRTREIPSYHIRDLLQWRIALGAPLKQLHMHHEDLINEMDRRWFKDHLEEFGCYSDDDDYDSSDDEDESMSEDMEYEDYKDYEDDEDYEDFYDVDDVTNEEERWRDSRDGW